jgi:hypothetical protein
MRLADDIVSGTFRKGVLLALAALLAVGLLRHSAELYALPKGFYGLSSVLVLLALMALARIPSIEQLRYVAAGEWGNLLGLDRVPEVRTLREKLKLLCGEQGRAARWNAVLAKEWIGQREIEQSSGLAFFLMRNAASRAAVPSLAAKLERRAGCVPALVSKP